MANWSIPVSRFELLLQLLENDVRNWIETECPRWYSGQYISWDDRSGTVSEYLKRKKIDPKAHERYMSFYVQERHHIAGSYVWALTTFTQFKDELRKTTYRGKRVWIDVLVNVQFDLEDVVSTTKNVYSQCEVLVMLTERTFSRAWCCLEAACYAKNECELHVVGTCNFVQRKNYFDIMTTSVGSDLPLIKDEIVFMFGSGPAFNRAIDDAIIVVYAACGRSPSHLPVGTRFFGITTQVGRMADGYGYEAWQSLELSVLESRLPENGEDEVPIHCKVVRAELRKLVDGSAIADRDPPLPEYLWRYLSSFGSSCEDLHGTYRASDGLLSLNPAGDPVVLVRSHVLWSAHRYNLVAMGDGRLVGPAQNVDGLKDRESRIGVVVLRQQADEEAASEGRAETAKPSRSAALLARLVAESKARQPA